jgi:hypothetical protein
LRRGWQGDTSPTLPDRRETSSCRRSRANGGRAQSRNRRSRPARPAAAMRNEASMEKPPPCAHCAIACASSPGSRLRRTNARNIRRRTSVPALG